MARRDYAGNATPSTLVSGIANNTLAFDIPGADAGSWPTGGANGKFMVTFDRGLPSEERVLAQSQSGGSFVVQNVGDRGVDGTSAVAHSAGATVEHTYSGIDADEANEHINTPALDHHTQYMLAAGGRHDLAARHTFATLGWTPGAPTTITPDAVSAEGNAVHPARGNHTHGFPTDVPIAVGTSLTEGAGSAFARHDHGHELGVGSIDAANLFGAGVVNDTALAAASVIAGKIAAGGVSATNQITDAIISLAKFANEAPTAFTPTWDASGVAPSIGNGTLAGLRYKLGRLCFFSFRLIGGTTTNFGTGVWEFGIPFAMHPDWQSGVNTFFPALVNMNNSGTEFLGVVRDGTTNVKIGIKERVTLALIGATSPFTWGTGDFMSCAGAFFTT